MHDRQPLRGWDYERFQSEKNSIVDQTGTDACSLPQGWQYNEFDTNGLSSSSLLGLFIPECLKGHPVPWEMTVCRVFKNQRFQFQWPVYVHSNHGTLSSLRI